MIQDQEYANDCMKLSLAWHVLHAKKRGMEKDSYVQIAIDVWEEFKDRDFDEALQETKIKMARKMQQSSDMMRGSNAKSL